MNKTKILEDLQRFQTRYSQLYQYVIVENRGTTKGYEFIGEMEWLDKKIKFLENILPYLDENNSFIKSEKVEALEDSTWAGYKN